jgi:hypothetical protein
MRRGRREDVELFLNLAKTAFPVLTSTFLVPQLGWLSSQVHAGCLPRKAATVFGHVKFKSVFRLTGNFASLRHDPEGTPLRLS